MTLNRKHSCRVPGRWFAVGLLAGIVLLPAGIQAQQKTGDFRITLAEAPASGSLYRRLVFLDSRTDTADLGIVQLGAFNRKARVVPETPLRQQFPALMTKLAEGAQGEGEMLFQLRQLKFAEVTGAMSEKGYCYLRANCYAATPDGYRLIGKVDTVLLVKAMDVTRAMFRRGSQAVIDCITASLQREAATGRVYSLQELERIDELEKQEIPLYANSVYQKGYTPVLPPYLLRYKAMNCLGVRTVNDGLAFL